MIPFEDTKVIAKDWWPFLALGQTVKVCLELSWSPESRVQHHVAPPAEANDFKRFVVILIVPLPDPLVLAAVFAGLG